MWPCGRRALRAQRALGEHIIGRTMPALAKELQNGSAWKSYTNGFHLRKTRKQKHQLTARREKTL